MKDWDDLKFILALSRARTMRAASEALGSNPATVSRRIDRLTSQVGRQLFKKERDGWRPTGETLQLIELAESIEREIAAFDSERERPDDQLKGEISINCFLGFRSIALVPNLWKLHTRYPNITVNLQNAGSRSLAHGEIDLSIQLMRPREGRLVHKQIGRRISAYYRRRGAPPCAGWIGQLRDFDHLPMMRQGLAYFARPPAMRLGTLADIEQAILSSDMAGPLMTCTARLHPELERIDAAELCSVHPIYLVYHETRRNDPVLQAAKQWVESCFSGGGNCCCGKCEPL